MTTYPRDLDWSDYERDGEDARRENEDYDLTRRSTVNSDHVEALAMIDEYDREHRFTGQDGVLTAADEAGIYGPSIPLEVALAPYARTQLQLVADNARDALLHHMSMTGGKHARSYAFGFMHPAPGIDTVDELAAMWDGLNQAIAKLDRDAANAES